MLSHLFFPEKIALVGASRTPGKVGHDILSNLVTGGFTGTVIPVNPAGGELLGLKVYKGLDEYPQSIDQAIIAVAKPQIVSAVKEALGKGAKSIIMVTSGFKEVDEGGAQLERELAELCKRSGARLLGPNCLGLLNSSSSLNASFAGAMPKAGRIGIFSQSGALCTSFLDVAKARSLGLSKLVSIGNKADINENDLLEFFAADPDTDVVTGYLENIVDGTSFVKTATAASSVKPVIILKSGTSSAGRKAAASHTGVVTGADTAYAAAFKRSGIIRAETFEALFDYATALSMQPLPQGDRVLIITNAGGPGTMAADAVENSGMRVAELETNTATPLREKLPATVRFSNPIDVLGDSPPERYSEALKSAQQDDTVDGIIIILTPQAMTDAAETARQVARTITGDKPVLISFMGGGDIMEGRQELAAAGIPDFPSPERAVAALKAMWEYSSWRSRPPRMVTRFRVNRQRVDHILSRSSSNGIYRLNEVKTKKVLEAYGFTIPRGVVVTKMDEAVEQSRRIGFPLAMKIVSSDMLNREETGGIRRKITSTQQVRDSYDLIMMRSRQNAPEARFEGLYLEKTGDPGLEVVLGMTRDEQFGPMLMFGLGGVFIETMKDVTFHLAPITREEAVQMLESTRSYAMLAGAQGENPVNVDAIAAALQRISQLTTDFPQITEMQITPLIIDESGTSSVVSDGYIRLEEPAKDRPKVYRDTYLA